MSQNTSAPVSKDSFNTKIIQRMRLENTSENHNKFYDVDVCYNKKNNKYLVIATWGRINSWGEYNGYQIKEQGKELDDVLDKMEKVLLQKLFKRGYEMKDIQRWPMSARAGDENRFIDESWD